MRILLTGASGFIGSALLNELSKYNFYIRAAFKKFEKKEKILNPNHEYIFINDINHSTDWSPFLNNIDCIIHCAGRAHIINDKSSDPLKEYRKINLYGTINLAEHAARVGVKRFIFLSSIGVNGNFTNKFNRFTHKDTPMPLKNYAKSKFEAENALKKISFETGLEIVIIRPPLVYGANVKGNFLRLLKLIKKGVPLPLGGINNQRSYIGLDNLINFIIFCIDHPLAKNETFLISDGDDISTPDLVKKISKFMLINNNIFSVPINFLKIGGYLFNKKKEIESLVESLLIDSNYAKKILNWSPPETLEKGLLKMVSHFKKNYD